jgi:hypothetical protein
MPTYAADLLPDASGRNLGNPSQRWNANLQALNVQGTVALQPVVGLVINPGGAIYVITAPITAGANTTAAQNLAQYVLPSGLLNATGKVLRATMAGTYTTQAGQTPVMSIGVYLGALQILAIATSALSAGQTSNKWRVLWDFTVYQAGTAAQLYPSGTMAIQTGGALYAAGMYISLSGPAGPIDLTISQNLSVQVSFSTNTSPANSCTQNIFILEILN